jgi:hypothetical protein
MIDLKKKLKKEHDQRLMTFINQVEKINPRVIKSLFSYYMNRAT